MTLPAEFKTYQTAAVEFMRPRDDSILALDMRMGKSAAALWAIDLCQLLIICPVVSMLPWVREIQRWRPQWADEIQLINAESTLVNRKKKIHILPYSLVSLFAQSGQLCKPKALFIDEMHYCKNEEAIRTVAALSLAHHAQKTVWISGTPMPSRPIELWPVLKHMGVMKNYKNYSERYCAGGNAPWGFDNRGASNLDELADKLAPVMFRRTKADLKGEWPEIQPPTVLELDLPLDEQEKQLNYKEIAKNPNPLAFVGVSDLLHLNALRKVPLVLEHVRNVLESEHKVVVYAWHRDVIEILTKELAEYQSVHIYGGMTSAVRQGKVDYFQKEPRCRVLVANYKAAGFSITLDAASYALCAEYSWVPGDMEQAIARLSGHGQTETIRVDICTIHLSVDSHVLHANLRKQDHINRVIQETPMKKLSKVDSAIRDLIETQADEAGVTSLAYVKSLIPASFEEADPEPAEEVEEEKPKKAKKDKAKKAKVKKVKPEPVEEEEEEDEDDEDEDDEISMDKLRNVAALTMKTCGPDKVKKLLNDLGAKKLSDLKPEQYANFVEVCDEMTEAEYADD